MVSTETTRRISDGENGGNGAGMEVGGEGDNCQSVTSDTGLSATVTTTSDAGNQ